MKILLLGLTGSGKTTIAKNIARKYGLKTVEVDDEVIRLNNGIWPEDEETIDKFFDKTSSSILHEDNVIYVISWMDKKDILSFSSAGFKIIELHARIEELINRKIKRDNPSETQLNRFKQNYKGYFEEVKDAEVQKHIDISIDTTDLTPDDVETIVYEKL